MPRAHRLAVGLFILAAFTMPAKAFMRRPYEDAQVVERSDLMVVASIKEGSVIVVPHARVHPDDGRSWETHVTLVIHEVLKGHSPGNELPVIIHYGLDVRVDDINMSHGSFEKPTTLPTPKSKLSIFDTGNSLFRFQPLIPDAQNDCIWCLRKGGNLARAGDSTLGISDPEDVQSAAIKSYLQCYLSPQPEPLVRAALQTQPDIAPRALRYLVHCEIQRILQTKDPAIRVEMLLPYYLADNYWAFQSESLNGIIAAGEVSGPYLMAVYDQAPDYRKDQIISAWGEVRYQPSVPLLIALLDREDKFWAVQKLHKGWWNADEQPITNYRRESYSRINAAIGALGNLHNGTARDVIQRTRQRWSAMDLENPEIVEACDAALKNLPPSSLPSPH